MILRRDYEVRGPKIILQHKLRIEGSQDHTHVCSSLGRLTDLVGSCYLQSYNPLPWKGIDEARDRRPDEFSAKLPVGLFLWIHVKCECLVPMCDCIYRVLPHI